MLVTLKEALADARAKKYCVPAFDCIEDVMVRTILETCQANRSPVIMMCLPGDDIDGNGWAYVPALIKAAAEFHDVPVVLHLDHATNMDDIQRAIDHKFTSVMFDGSALPFDKNVAVTKSVVDLAHPKGISVEAELGHVGGADVQETVRTENVLTEPDEVRKFVADTDVDALAVSIGTSHGVYQSLPDLNIDCLKALNQVSSVPLVLHGGSGTPDDQIQESVKYGICKLNIYADCRIAMTKGIHASSKMQTRIDAPLQQLFGPMKEELAKVVEEKIVLLNSNNQV
jgi:fructose-bisphosphate aldolase class II